MKQLLVLDAKDYAEDMEEIVRVGIRSIVFRDEKILLLNNTYGELKFPGGGQEKNETDIETLIRETLEETGYTVDPSTVAEFGEVIEKRLSVKEPMIWHQFNRYYFCDIKDTPQQPLKLTPHEIRLNFAPIWISLDDAIKMNEEMLAREGKKSFNQREYETLKLIKAYKEGRLS